MVKYKYDRKKYDIEINVGRGENKDVENIVKDLDLLDGNMVNYDLVKQVLLATNIYSKHGENERDDAYLMDFYDNALGTRISFSVKVKDNNITVDDFYYTNR